MLPNAAHPYDLEQLLKMPLERLLTLRITSRRIGDLAGQVLPMTARRLNDGGQDAP